MLSSDDFRLGAGRPGCLALLFWSAALPVGLVITWFVSGAFYMLFPVDGPVSNFVLVFGIMGLLIGGLAGALVGIIQRPLLPDLQWKRKWVRATALGWAFAGALYFNAGFVLDSLFVNEGAPFFMNSGSQGAGLINMLPVLIPGCVCGIGQYFALRSSVRHAYLWLILNILGWSLGALIVWASLLLLGTSNDVPNLGLLLVAPATAGVVTAIGLNSLIQKGSAPIGRANSSSTSGSAEQYAQD